MSSRPTIYFSNVEGGALTSRGLRQVIASFEGKRVEVTIRLKRNYRSNRANSYYHGVVVDDIATEMRRLGWESPSGGPITNEEVHELLKLKFLSTGTLVNPSTGEYETTPGSTTRLTSSEFADYIAAIKQWATVFDRVVQHDDGSFTIIPFKFRDDEQDPEDSEHAGGSDPTGSIQPPEVDTEGGTRDPR